MSDEMSESLTVTLDREDWVLIASYLDGIRTWVPEAVEAIEAAIERGEAMAAAKGDADA